MALPAHEPQHLYALIYDVLKEHLLDRSFPSGLVFGETIVARAFGASRVPAAAALQRLKSEGLLKSFDGRGLVAADAAPGKLIRRELVEAGLRLPSSVVSSLEVRNHYGRIYPEIEHTIAASLSFGRFLVNESALAEHYGVSRTVAHEVLTRLERTGLIAQEGNQRWYAGPLTPEDLRDHFEVRWLLEPVALAQSMDSLGDAFVEARRRNLVKAREQTLTPLRLEKLETELHVHTVLAKANPQLVAAIHRSQMHVIATHSTFAAMPHVEELRRTIEEHLEIYDLVSRRDKEGARAALESHVKRALEPNIERLRRLDPLPDSVRPSFLVPADT